MSSGPSDIVVQPPKPGGANSPFHRGLRQIFLLQVLSFASIYVIGILGFGLWWLCAVYTLFLMIAMIWQLARLRPPEWGALAMLVLTLLVCGVAIFTDANIFTPNDPRPGVHERQTFILLALTMFGLLSVVWTVRILMDFPTRLGRTRAALAGICAILFLLLSNNESIISAGARSYSVTSAFYHMPGGRQFGSELNDLSYRLQGLRQHRELLIGLLLISGGILGIASCFDGPKPLPRNPPPTYEI